MVLSLVTQRPLAAVTLGVLAALQGAIRDGRYFDEVRVVQLAHWQPEREDAAILLLEKGSAWPRFAWQSDGEALGLPVLPLLVRQRDDPVIRPGGDVRDRRFYFVSNGIVLEEAELADPASRRVLRLKLESHFPLLSRLTLLRQRQPVAELID